MKCTHGLCSGTHCPDWGLDGCLLANNEIAAKEITWYRHEDVPVSSSTQPAAAVPDDDNDGYGETQTDEKSENRKRRRTCSFRDFLCGYEDNGKYIKGYHQVALEFFKHRQVTALNLVQRDRP